MELKEEKRQVIENREREEEEEEKEKAKYRCDRHTEQQHTKKKHMRIKKKDNCCLYIKNQKSIEWIVNSNC